MDEKSIIFILRKAIQLILKKKVFALNIVIIVLCGNYLTAISMNFLELFYQRKIAISEVWALMPEVSILSFAPAGALGVVLFAFLTEARILGWTKSSIKRSLEIKSESSKIDWLYTILFASNLVMLLGFFFTLGIGYYIGEQIRGLLGVDLLVNAPFLYCFIALLFTNSLIFYGYHRILHSGFLWELHKTHHSATELLIITNFRHHPLEYGIRTLVYTIPASLLGVSPEVLITYSIFSGFIVLMQHSDMDWNLPFVERYLIIGAQGHRVHHSTAELHQNKNLGYLVLWDWLFGTLYHVNENKIVAIEELKIGLHASDDKKNIYNIASFKAQFWEVYTESVRSFMAHCLGKFRSFVIYR